MSTKTANRTGVARAWPSAAELAIPVIGPCERLSPLVPQGPFVEESDRVLLPQTSAELAPFLDRGEPPPSFERAGARRSIYFDPKRVACGVVTCGGLCPASTTSSARSS